MIVLDANILIRAVLGQRVGQLLDYYCPPCSAKRESPTQISLLLSGI